MINIRVGSLPSLKEADEILREAEQLNPGPWVDHSLFVA